MQVHLDIFVVMLTFFLRVLDKWTLVVLPNLPSQNLIACGANNEKLDQSMTIQSWLFSAS